ncbi:MAG: hypothetical protein JW755_07585 [Candidatus Aminicenantes bacterium]|nr:hypothetical protein [Candidatus Aminicenantes bacterium]
MSLKMVKNPVTTCLKNTQTYYGKAKDLWAGKIYPERDAIEKAGKKAEEYVTKIISKFEEP